MSHLEDHVLEQYALDPELLSHRHDVIDHLANCEACRQRVQHHSQFETSLGDPDTWLHVDTGARSSAYTELRDFAVRVATEDADAKELLAKFNHTSAAGFVWADISNKVEYQTGGVVRLLCRRASDLWEREPLYALALADAAVTISNLLSETQYPRRSVHQLRGDAWIARATALRFLGRLVEALEALDVAESEFQELPHASNGLQRVAYGRAAVLCEQDKLDLAQQFAADAARAAEHLGDTDRAMRARHLLGHIRFDLHDYQGAVDSFQTVLQYGEATGDKLWIARESLTLGHCLIEQGRLSEAEQRVLTSLRLFSELDLTSEVTRARWAMAQLLVRSGAAHDETILRLRQCMAEFTSLGMITDAGLVALDLAEVLAAVGRYREVEKLLARVTRTFVKAGRLTGALAAFAYLKEAAARGEVPVTLVEHVRRFVTRADRQPELAFAPPPDALL